MPDIRFYLLPSDSERQRLSFACKLIEKAYRQSPKVYILTASEQQTRLLDDQLWTFRAGSFVPHQIFSGTIPVHVNQILLGPIPAPDSWRATIINLSENCPEDFLESDRVLEVLDNSTTCKQAGRERYRQYQQLGLPIQTHKI